MMEVTTVKLQKQPYNATTSTLLNRKRCANKLIFIVLIVLFTVAFLPFSLALAQEAPYPEPLLPKTGATNVEVTSIVFSWKPFYVGTEEYTFQLSKNIDFSNLVIEAKIRGDSTAYTYRGTLEYNTTYSWRVMSSKPLGDWSPVSTFTTKASPAASTNNATAPPQDSTKKSSIISYLENIGWPIVGVIAAVIVVLIIALVVLTKPKTPPGRPGQWQGTQPPPHMQQPSVCLTCGSPNAPERKFCSNCGGNLMGTGPQQTWGPPPTQQQAITCPTCGFPNNTPDRKFCGNCGGNLTTAWQQPPRGPQQQQNYQVYQTFSCPICGAPIIKGSNPCPNCRTWLDWGAY